MGYVEGDDMRQIGERSIASIPHNLTVVEVRKFKQSMKKDAGIYACKKCGAERSLTEGYLRKFKGSYTCYSCREKDKAEVNEAILNMALRKFRK